MTAPERLLTALTAARRNGRPFTDAWPAALADAMHGTGRDAGDWAAAFSGTRDAWHAAFDGAPATRAHRAVAAVALDPDREPLTHRSPRGDDWCAHCDEPIPASRKRGARYCSLTCQRATHGRTVPAAA